LIKFNLKPEIKWPNDIFVRGKKIAGVLIENKLRSNYIQNSIIGIGLNVNELNFKGFIATSVKNETGEFKSVKDVLYSFFYSFNKTWNTFINDLDSLDKEYHNFLYLRDINAKYQDYNGEFNGVLKGVKSSGRLLIEKEDRIKDYDLKEIKFILKNVL
jgi:BirA family biotin operon repressor/biotin-[acetyl-CoA-carboxylase] ligase